MKDTSAGLKLDSGGRNYFKQRKVEFRTIVLGAETLHGKWLRYDTNLEPLDWSTHPEIPQIRAFALQASKRFLDFWNEVFDVAVARALATRDRGILRHKLFEPSSYFDIGVPEEQRHSSIPPALHSKIISEYNASRFAETENHVYYLTEYLSLLSDDWIEKLKPFEKLWTLTDEKARLTEEISQLRATTEEEQNLLQAANSLFFHASRAHRIRLRLILLRGQKRSASQLLEALSRSQAEIDSRYAILNEKPIESKDTFAGSGLSADSYLSLCRSILDRNSAIESIYLKDVDPALERSMVREACRDILHRLGPIRRAAAGYSLIAGERHGAMSLNPVMLLWKEKPNPPRSEAPALSLEMNTKQTIDCLIRLAHLADPDLGYRELMRGKIAKLMRGIENLANLKNFLIPGSAYPLREIHPLDYPEFRSRVIGETRSPLELGANETAVLTGAWYSKRQHSLYCTIGADNGRLLRILWNSERSPGPPAFYFAMGQFVHDCMEDSLIYRRSGSITFRECVEDYYDFEDRIRKNKGEKTGRRKSDNSRPGVRFMFAVLYSRMITELLTGSLQSQFRHPATEKWMETNLGLSRDRARLKHIRIKLREIISNLRVHA